jgi:hypothetical protein
LRAFGGALIVLAPGILNAPSLDNAKLVGVAALVASVAAGIRAVQAYIPALTVAKYLGPLGVYVDSFLRAFLGSLVIMLPGALDAPNLHTGTGLATAALIGAFTAGIRALQGMLTSGESPAPQLGLAEPSYPHEHVAGTAAPPA